jgi:hypothetical protein
MTGEVIALTEELQAIGLLLERVVDRLDAADARERRHRAGTFVLAACVAAIAALGAWFYQAEQDDDHRACLAANEARADIRSGIVSTVVKVIERRGDNPDSYRPLIDDITADLEETLPNRAC